MVEKKPSGLSSSSRALALVLIGLLVFLGLWLGSHSQLWLGLIAFLGAFAGVVMMAHLDLRPTEQERRRGWERIRQHGKLRYIGKQVLGVGPFYCFCWQSICLVPIGVARFGSALVCYVPGCYGWRFGFDLGGLLVLASEKHGSDS